MSAQIKITVPIVIQPDGDGYLAYVPSLPGCCAGGDTLEEARNNIRDAAYLYIKALLEKGRPLPLGVTAEVVEKRPEVRAESSPLFPDFPTARYGTRRENTELTVPVPA